VLDAAATLFALRGVDAVSLRDIAAAADVHLELIRLYVGTREKLELAVFDYLSDQVARAVAENPLSGQGFEPDTVMGKWVRVVGALAIAGRPVRPGAQFNPVQAMARTLEEGYGLDSRSARLRAAQIVAAVLGWRIIEDYLVQAGRLKRSPAGADAHSFDHRGREETSGAATEPKHTAMSGAPALGRISVPGGGGGGLKRSDLVM
jgi:AcrR family transcriptional regulator